MQALAHKPTSNQQQVLNLRLLGSAAYEPIWQQMQNFTRQRTLETPDEIWALEHPEVFTLGLAGKPEHLLNPGQTPIVKVDRGGQVTWHGPGQLVVYLMLDVRRLGYSVRDLINLIENSLVAYLASLGVAAEARADAPGVYLTSGAGAGAKIAALGLKISRGFSYHGLSFNLTNSLEPFQRINPCGYAGMQVARLADLIPNLNFQQVQTDFLQLLISNLNISQVHTLHQLPEF